MLLFRLNILKSFWLCCQTRCTENVCVLYNVVEICASVACCRQLCASTDCCSLCAFCHLCMLALWHHFCRSRYHIRSHRTVFPNLFDQLSKTAPPTMGSYPCPLSESCTKQFFFTEMPTYFGCTPSWKGTDDILWSLILMWRLSLITSTVGSVFLVPVYA